MTPFEVLAEAKRRSAEAVIARSGISHDGLRRHMRALLAGEDAKTSLLQEPVLEGAHPFVQAPETMNELSGRLLHPDLIRVLDDLPDEHEYRFPGDRKPFLHQTDCWQRLAEQQPQSVLVTSGTGSGKTECFLFPVLSDLASQVASSSTMLAGVQAIMLYPLNALIESQRERLSVWTRPFRGKLRYCLYNGALPESEREENRRRVPEQVIDRDRLRKTPPPILVTNITMLEYMLVRSQDRPILDASRGALKWIVLDEAHSLVGAAAAEIALLLRRTMLAFGVEPGSVRFVATSATIGSGEIVRADLQKFLADVAGVPPDRVHVIEGRRQMPTRPEAKNAIPVDIRNADPALLYDALGSNTATWQLVERLFEGGVPLRDFRVAAKAFDVSAEELVLATAAANRGRATGREERLAPIRVHAFERAIPGIWSCINPECPLRPIEWPFGRVLVERADDCPDCGAPVLEILTCAECGEVFLEGVETNGRLLPPLRSPPLDEFAFDSARDRDVERDEDDNALTDDDGPPSIQRLFALNPSGSATGFWLDRSTWAIVDGSKEALNLHCDEHSGMSACPHCRPHGGKEDVLRPIRFGAPFILGNVAPILLEGVAPPSERAPQLPSEGRRLLSFTDSREGTARLAAKLQTESERNFVRSFVYHQVQDSMRPIAGSEARIRELEHEIAEMEKIYRQTRNMSLRGAVERSKRDLAALAGGGTDGIAWPVMLERLSERVEVSSWIDEVWHSRDAELFNAPARIAEFLLFREFARRPKRANSLETLGLARLRSPGVDLIPETLVPEPFRRRGIAILEWRDYLNAILTWFVRANGAISISSEMLHWVSAKGKRTRLLDPSSSAAGERGVTPWPNGYSRAHPRSRPVALLLRRLDLNLDRQEDRDDLAECLQSAWAQLLVTFSGNSDRLAFDLSKTFIAPVAEAFYCPVTRRLLDSAPFGLTPYGLEDTRPERQRAQPVSIPRHPMPALGAVDLKEMRRQTRYWLADQPAIIALREKGAWTDISDRIALFSDYIRSAEHSAQQDNSLLRKFEQQFKAGEINILNCSTTMEMGVDIGSVSTVMMTNVPPSIANYRQRVGRAGRRGQATSLAFTFCKDRPLDQEAFRAPLEFLNRSLAAPKVTLSSRPIVQRHVNAWLLAVFMRENAGDALTMHIGGFFGCPADIAAARPLKREWPVQQFVDWLAQPSTQAEQEGALATLVNRSVAEGDRTLIDQTQDAILRVGQKFVAEWEGLRALANDEGGAVAARSRMGMQLKRLCQEFLLSGLADRGFLPGHGFPTDVVTFLPAKIDGSVAPDGSHKRWAVGPQRSLDLAIRDYAPGSEVVLNGLVHKSAGVTLNWKRPASAEKTRDIQSLRIFWQCAACGASGTTRGSSPEFCQSCGSTEIGRREFLQPAGFTVDPRDKPHADTDILSYVPPQEPAVSAGEIAWRNFPDPGLGRYRCSREGLVFYSNKGGPTAFGYAICLECGRAEPDTEYDGSGNRVNPLADHRPLRFTRGSERCPGNDRPFSIKRNLWLGHEIVTDVFELQPRQKPASRAAANALVIALREALSRTLGIEHSEMGFSVTNSRNALGGDALSLFLFDRAAGGAGFSVLFEDHTREVIETAAQILDCKTPGCEKACAACVLVSDAPRGEDALDRTAALQFMREHLTFTENLQPEDRFVQDATLSVAPADEIARCLQVRPHATSMIFIPAGSESGLDSDWQLAKSFLEWGRRGNLVTLVFEPNVIKGSSWAEKLAIRDFALRRHIQLATGERPCFANGAVAVALVESASDACTIWASRDLEMGSPGPLWAVPSQHPLARGTSQSQIALSVLDPGKLLPPAEAYYREIDTELDCSLMEFGNRAGTLFADALKSIGALPDEIASVSYSDSFVTSPLVCRLLVDTVSALVKIAGGDCCLQISTRPPRPPRHGEEAREPWQIFHDWRDPRDQGAVIEAYGDERDIRVLVSQSERVPHGRFFEIRFRDESAASIILDQGFGAWLPVLGARVRFDFCQPALRQAEQLGKANVLLKRKGAGKSYLVARCNN